MDRKLAAILAIDVVGYSALMEADEAGTFDRLKSGRKELFEPEIARRHGRIFKLMGDGLLAEFGSVVDAVECAVTLQRGMAERNASVAEDQRFEVRIGINLGEVIVEGEDRYGEGVNVASRLQQFAEPGGICVSEKVSKEVQKKLAFEFEPMGEQRVKNIAEPIYCYRVNLQLPKATPAGRPVSLELPDKAAVAVLPFANMSSDPEQEFFAEGLAEDLITDLSKVPGLLVIARNSSFVYKGRSVDVRSIAKDLGVRYVVEGSVQKAAARVRINAQLIDAHDNAHVWADRFDGELADVFALQDEVVGKIVSAISGAFPSARFMTRQRTSNLKAYEFLVRGRALVTQSPEANKTARPLLERAIQLDPGFAEAHAWLAMSHVFGSMHWGETEEHRALGRAEAQLAVSLDPGNAGAHTILGYILHFDLKADEAAAEFATALRIDPNHADAWIFLAESKAHLGNAVEGIECVQNAFRLDPYPPGRYYWVRGYVEYAARRYEDAVDTLRHETTYRTGSRRILAAALARLGQIDEAKEEARQFLAANPHFSIRQWASTQPFRREADRQHFVDGYLMAGLPE
ncbi:adenylate/guanylate cyclase domain-containing protein [Mesorhizobium mediterraneum]|uniref:adenylate/guanylate cyclase domain-containing protein n=1 Tax=Mesorhizobium mediterraneum TaxID=43617 RepID=UPI00177E6C46|nr:adenylate/guanylate cyclase domain-containing protein [Mesorhizobium mediterraneum]